MTSLSDLVVTGAAQTAFARSASGRAIWDEADVFATPRMLQLFRGRTVGQPRFLSCLRAAWRKATTASERLVSVRILLSSRFAPRQLVVQAIVASRRARASTATTLVIFARGRTIVNVGGRGALSGVAPDVQEQMRLSRVLAARIRI